jgi:hypothetical protein
MGRPTKRPGFVPDPTWDTWWDIRRERVGMPNPWELRLEIDARREDRIRVWPSKFDVGPQVFVAVRTGPVLTYVLDAHAVRSLATAWAQAQASTAHMLPEIAPNAAPARNRGERPSFAFPAADVVAEGPQRWDITPPRHQHEFTTVTTNWLTVRVHDRRALEVYTQAWSAACALAIKVMPGAVPSFHQLLHTAYGREYERQWEATPVSQRPQIGR